MAIKAGLATTVICGYGRVASELIEALKRRGFSYVVIEYDPTVFRRLRAQGEPAIYGDAANPLVLAQARIGAANQLAVLMSDARAQLAVTADFKSQRGRIFPVIPIPLGGKLGAPDEQRSAIPDKSQRKVLAQEPRRNQTTTHRDGEVRE